MLKSLGNSCWFTTTTLLKMRNHFKSILIKLYVVTIIIALHILTYASLVNHLRNDTKIEFKLKKCWKITDLFNNKGLCVMRPSSCIFEIIISVFRCLVHHEVQIENVHEQIIDCLAIVNFVVLVVHEFVKRFKTLCWKRSFCSLI